MIHVYIAVAVMLALFALAWIYRDALARMLPGWKHAIVGTLTTAGSFLLGLAQYLQSLDLSPLLHDPKVMLLVTGGIGLLVFVLSWVTPRAGA
jgi:uncharacterized BrkB/YihY/UPF0761 family membrane protein